MEVYVACVQAVISMQFFYCKSLFQPFKNLLLFCSQTCNCGCTVSLKLTPCAPSVSAESHSPHGRPQFVPQNDRASKTYERLQKKLKERQGGGGSGGGGQVKDSPPSSPQKNCSSPQTLDIHNGFGGKGQEAEQGHFGQAAAGTAKPTGRGRNGESEGKEVKDVRIIDAHTLADTLHFLDVWSELFLDSE